MLDCYHSPPPQTGEVQIFTLPCTVTNLQWKSWIKPRGRSQSFVYCIGGGAGGGGGATGATNTLRGGGGGGGSSGVSRLVIPSFYLPDRLFIQNGAAGVGAAAGAVGSSAILSYVSVAPDTTASNIVLLSGNAAAVGGGAGTSGTGGAGGTASTIATIANCSLAGTGATQFIAGNIGAAGGAQTGAVGVDVTIPVTSVLTTGGAGGAGINTPAQSGFAGGSFGAISNSYLSQVRPAPPAAGSNNGSGGLQLWQPFWGFGGCGGSSNDGGAGGFGGNGAYGAGGGGGGGGTTGGSGGDGGNGIVIIISW